MSTVLDIGPDEHGQFPQPAVATMEEVGSWLDVNGAAIYDSQPLWPHVYNLTRSGGAPPTQLRMTRGGDAVYIAVFLEWSSVPRTAAAATTTGADECWKLPLPLPLPFIIDGGLDASWPDGELTGVTLLGQPEAELTVALDESGLKLAGLPGGCLGPGVSHVAVLKLQY